MAKEEMENADVGSNDYISLGEKQKEFDGVYLYTRTTIVKNRKTLVHMLQSGEKTFNVWGKAKLDKVLPTLPRGTKVSIKYIGKKELKNSPQPMSDFDIFVPKGTKYVENTFLNKPNDEIDFQLKNVQADARFDSCSGVCFVKKGKNPMNIKEFAQEKKLTRYYLAALFCVHPITISRWLDDGDMPTGRHIKQIIKKSYGRITVKDMTRYSLSKKLDKLKKS